MTFLEASISMDWPALIGTAGFLAGTLLTLFVKDKAREAAHAEVRNQITTALATFKTDLISTLDNTYRRIGECELLCERREK